ncbi:MAG: 4Fe-4S dicluster domain-containing protein [Thermodesulfovibrionia bacterium]|nr:4Fe-4S dicluster domain-containing protein [Thermodesulfovibrionia bacterium]
MRNHKGITRRQFLGSLAVASAGLSLGDTALAEEEPKRYAKLHDSTKCIGCKRCMSACKRWNKLKVDRFEELTDRETDLTGHTWVVVNLTRDIKNGEDLSYLHWACQHCQKPACAGACPVKAIRKMPEGPVVIDEKKCIGCRYCYQSCPYKVPRFDFGKRITRKCTMCYDRIPIVKPACVAGCPVGALDFGLRKDVLLQAKKRVETVGGYLLGEYEAGGTDFLTILKTKPEDIGLVVAPKKVVSEDLDKIRITSSGFLGAGVLVGLMYIYSRTGEGE